MRRCPHVLRQCCRAPGAGRWRLSTAVHVVFFSLSLVCTCCRPHRHSSLCVRGEGGFAFMLATCRRRLRRPGEGKPPKLGSGSMFTHALAGAVGFGAALAIFDAADPAPLDEQLKSLLPRFFKGEDDEGEDDQADDEAKHSAFREALKSSLPVVFHEDDEDDAAGGAKAAAKGMDDDAGARAGAAADRKK